MPSSRQAPGALVLDVWRAACHYVTLEETTARIATLLEGRLPVRRLLVRRIDLPHSSLETVAASPTASPENEPLRTPCTAEQLGLVLAACHAGRVLHGLAGRARTGALSLLAPSTATDADVLVGPLVAGDGPTGALVLVAREGGRFTAEHRALLASLLEPMSVALDNDHRLREMNTLRETAEAERRSLLARLGRKDLADLIVGADSGLKPVMERVGLVSRSDVPVLILGETGAGKELIARAIRSGSSRAAGPFIRVNCGSIPPELIDSELFGHQKGSFTGAVATRKGWFERADGGTLFLDEIGELPLAAQVRLLHVLQDGHFDRVGGHQVVRVDVRIVAATHRDLTTMVARGEFREDLWYRIAVFPILVPPLRERPQDIPALVAHFAQRAATRFGLAVRLPTPQDLNTLAAYAWPGNIRELQAVIDRAAILGNGERLEIATALGVPDAGGAPPAESMARGRAAIPGTPGLTLDAAMRHHIERALATTLGRVEGPFGAAALLGVNPHTLRGRMRRLGIAWKSFRPRAGVAR